VTTSPGRTDEESPLVLTFYSYETSIGRSLAAASVAVLLAAERRRVLVVDWDLESPGVGRLLLEAGDGRAVRAAEGRPGVVDLVEACRDGDSIDWRECVTEVAVDPAREPVRLIHAGRPDGEHAARVRAIDWDAKFVEDDLGNYLEKLRSEWLREFDLVLVDSHPGVGDSTGICAINLPDVLVSLVTAAPQGVAGVVDVARRARQARKKLPFDRAQLVVVPVLARQQGVAEYQRDRRLRADAALALDGLYTDFVPRGLSALTALDVLRIPNIPSWADEPEGVRDPSGTGFSYGALARLLGSGLEWEAPAGEESDRELIRAVIDALGERLPGLGGELDDRERVHVEAFLEDVRAAREPVARPSAEQLVSQVAGQVGVMADQDSTRVVAVCAALAFVLGDPPHSPATVRSLLPLVDDVLSRPSGRELIRALRGAR
jgi:Mrp family chromosome partitioning ATPase